VRGFRITAAATLIIASVTGFYMSEFGVAIDPSIVRSVVETDTREAATLLSTSFFVHVGLFGILPAIVVSLIPLRRQRLPHELAVKVSLIVASILVPAAAIYGNYLEISFYAQAHRNVRLFMNPVYPFYATGQYLAELFQTHATTAAIEPNDIVRPVETEAHKPLAIVLVLGETARADHWALNGYERDTNRYTTTHEVVNYPDVTACGTSTADSLPCIFSPLTRDEFSHVEAARHENLLALMKRLAIDVRWIDNSTGCKGLCDDADFVSVAGDDDAALCDTHGCYDELLLRELERNLAATQTDMLIVLHERGSHGPTYHQNVPSNAKAYFPECTLDTFRDCDDQSLKNAYDNTILYSDRVLGEVIDYLQSVESEFDTALLYVSDHGESLGENGIYLHGFPYVLAPESQTRVPMMFWASDSFYGRSGIDRGCLQSSSSEPHSHDSIFHTVVGLAEAGGTGYRDELDVLSPCRQAPALSLANESAVDDTRSVATTTAHYDPDNASHAVEM
jgi:lipid A ethanolaminephosphotransferase